jgi:scyllo-inosamine-4-phosphate amidinotransferase 1
MLTPNVNNEWGQLKKVILGTSFNAQIPVVKDKALHCIDYAHYTDDKFSTIPTGPYPTQVLEETEEDLNNIETILKSLGVEVYRPPKILHSRPFNDSYYDYCPRDSMLVIKDKVIATPMTLRQRRDEADKYKKLFTPESWVQFPKPTADDSLYDRSDLSRSTLMNNEPVFDAANILRANYDLLYLVSNTGNKAGAEYLQNWLRDNISINYKVHLAENIYAYIHIDTTFVFLREGLVLVNPARVTTYNMPNFLKSWHAINAPEPYPTQVMSDWCPASPWLGMNILSINEKLVMVEEHQIMLMKLLKKTGIESIPVRLRHARTLSGGPHCITLDIERK